MMKKHQKRSIYVTYQGNSLKQLLKKTFGPSKENPNIEVILIKLLTLYNYWSDQMKKTICAVKVFLLT